MELFIPLLPERDLPIVTTKGINSIHEGTRRFPHAMGIHGDFKWLFQIIKLCMS